MSRSCIHVDPLPSQQRGEWFALRANISGHPRWRNRKGEIYFEVPESYASWTAMQGTAQDRHDTWLRAAIFPAMEAGRDLVIHGAVSATLLANIEVYQSIICDWWPKYRVVNVAADREVAEQPVRAPEEAVLTFSGGLDSIHALYCHQQRLRGRNSRRIPLCIFVHGYDIRREDEAFQDAYRRAQHIVTALGSQLAAVRTNLRRFLPPWAESYPTALAAALSIFSARFSEGLVASSVNYRNHHLHEFGYGSSPVSDWLLSAHDFRVVHDLANAPRVEKTRILVDCEVARRYVRVCWAGADLSTNCGECSKCLSQMLCMRAVGITDFRAFEQVLSPERVADMPIPSPVHREDLQSCLAYARAYGQDHLAEFLALRQRLQDAQPGDRQSPHGSDTHTRRCHRGLVQRVAGHLAKLAPWPKKAA